MQGALSFLSRAAALPGLSDTAESALQLPGVVYLVSSISLRCNEETLFVRRLAKNTNEGYLVSSYVSRAFSFSPGDNGVKKKCVCSDRAQAPPHALFLSLVPKRVGGKDLPDGRRPWPGP